MNTYRCTNCSSHQTHSLRTHAAYWNCGVCGLRTRQVRQENGEDEPMPVTVRANFTAAPAREFRLRSREKITA